MAEVFKNSKVILTDSTATAYTCPAGKTAIVFGSQATITDLAVATKASLWYLDSSTANAIVQLCLDVPLPANSAVSLLTSKLVLEAGDALRVSVTGKASVAVSILEIDNV